MNTMEDKVRLALRETGEEISPHSVPPLRLRGTRRTRLPRIPGRWGTWLTPLAAAAAVAAVVAGSLAISATFHGHARSTGQAAAARWNGSPAGPRSALREVPPYFVVLPPQALIYARTALVRSTVTGRVLATVSPPRPYKVFTWVSGTADDRTFVLAAQRWWNISSGQAGTRAQDRDNNAPTVFFKLAFDPATGTATLTRLAVPEKITATNLGGVGVSPDGTRLALDFRNSIQIVTLATGAVRTWTWPGTGWIGNWKPEGQIFSWSADGRYLEFQQWGGRHDTMHVRILDTTAPGTSLDRGQGHRGVPVPARGRHLRGQQFVPHPGRHQDRHLNQLLPEAEHHGRRLRPDHRVLRPHRQGRSSTRTGSARPSAGRRSSGPARTAAPWSSVTPGARGPGTAAATTSSASLPGTSSRRSRTAPTTASSSPGSNRGCGAPTITVRAGIGWLAQRLPPDPRPHGMWLARCATLIM